MSSREAFEKYVEEGEYLALDRDPSGEYCDRETQSAWEAWQAATERAAEIAYDHLDDPFLSGHGYDHLDDPFLSGHGYATGVSEAIREGNETLTGAEK